jgi:hypothetical protein
MNIQFLHVYEYIIHTHIYIVHDTTIDNIYQNINMRNTTTEHFSNIHIYIHRVL